MDVFGKRMDKRTFLSYFGNHEQFAAARRVILNYGNAKGVEAVEVYTGTGLRYTVLPDRAMDIAHASYKGIPIGYITKNGITSPHYYNKEGTEWLRTFFGGLLTTCGLTYMGAPCEDNGEKLGLHGRISTAQAYDVSVMNEWIGDSLELSVSGKVKEAVLFGENLVMERRIISHAGRKSITIYTSVENEGFRPEPLMILFHFNYGYPLVSPSSILFGPIKKVVPRDEQARADKGVARYAEFDPPTPGYREKVFFLEFETNSEGDTAIMLYNPELEIGIIEQFNVKECPKFTYWKQMGAGDYVIGLEPGTATPIGRDKVRAAGELMMIEPGEIKEFNMGIRIIEGKEEYENARKNLENIEKVSLGFI